MKASRSIERCCFAATVLLLANACAQTQPATVAIRGATIVSVTDGSRHVNQTVLVDGNRIVAVGPADEVGIPEGAEVIDAAGGYLIPGLWDTHVHSAASLEWHFPLYLAHGITSVRNTAKITNAKLSPPCRLSGG